MIGIIPFQDEQGIIRDYYIIKWHHQNLLQRRDDKPASLFYKDGKYKLSWYINSDLNRKDDKPAIIANHYYIWYNNHEHYRKNDKPAFIFRTFLDIYTLAWYKDGELHRDGDKPAVISRIVDRYFVVWMQNGMFHRNDNKPAVITETKTQWWEEGRFIREIDSNGENIYNLAGMADTNEEEFSYFLENYENPETYPVSNQIIPESGAIFEHPVTEVSQRDLNYLNEISPRNPDLKYLEDIYHYTSERYLQTLG